MRVVGDKVCLSAQFFYPKFGIRKKQSRHGGWITIYGGAQGYYFVETWAESHIPPTITECDDLESVAKFFLKRRAAKLGALRSTGCKATCEFALLNPAMRRELEQLEKSK